VSLHISSGLPGAREPSRARIAVLGTPTAPVTEWTEASLRELVELGFTGVQLNIAWSYRPADEPLNLEDVWGDDERVAARLRLIGSRAALAKRLGLRTLFHFGAPFQGRAGFGGDSLPQCVADPTVLQSYARRVAEFGAAMPDIDDLLIYTYDQDAWLCSEFDTCPRCTGVPLHDRVSTFVNAVAAGWREYHPAGRTWWEPWELSAGQTLSALPLLDAATVGLMVHSNVGEVISTMPADLFVRTVSETCSRLAMPVIAEVFLSSCNEEVEPWLELPTPLVTIAQLRAVEAVRGVVGVKEYFGVRPGEIDVNLAAAAEYFADPSRNDAELLGAVYARSGLDEPALCEFWAQASRAYQVLPWDASWFVRQLGRSRVDHELTAATVRGTQSAASAWETPAWRSTRAATFMRVDDSEPHVWLLEDVGLRFGLAADAMDAAICSLCEGRDTRAWCDAILRQLSEAIGFATRCRAYALHVRETILAGLLRRDTLDDERRAELLDELGRVLRADAANQRRELARRAESNWTPAAGSPLQRQERWVVPDTMSTQEIDDAIALFESDHDAFLGRFFHRTPAVAAKGQFSLTSR